MSRWSLRIRVPDRPGSLGQLATSIGALRGDVVSFDISERGEGFAVDQFLIDFPESVPPELMRREVTIEDGFEVLSLVPIADP